MQKIFQIPLKQQIGAASKPVVKVGDSVKKGILIAKCPDGMLGANLHASVSGKVSDVTEDYIEIEAASLQTDEFEPIKGNSILELVEAAGIAGMGGAGFPTHVKLKTKFEEAPIVIINAAECEPILEHNIDSIEKNPLRVYRGLVYAMEAVNSKKGIIAIKEKHKKAIEALESVMEGDRVQISLLPDLYPMGEERAVIRETLGILLDVHQLPSEAGVIVINSETASRITDAVELRKPVISKDLTVGGRIHNSKLIRVFTEVPLGTKVETLLKQIEDENPASESCCEDYGEIIMGGPFTGKSCSKDTPVIKTTGGIILAMPFIKEKRKMGLLVCACGGNKQRLEEIAGHMGAEIVGAEYCKQAVEVGGKLKCQNPGKCPGQSQKVLRLRKAGAEVLLISNCTDCTNTVMSIAPQLKMPVYHSTDGALRAVNKRLIRKVKIKEA